MNKAPSEHDAELNDDRLRRLERRLEQVCPVSPGVDWSEVASAIEERGNSSLHDVMVSNGMPRQTTRSGLYWFVVVAATWLFGALVGSAVTWKLVGHGAAVVDVPVEDVAPKPLVRKSPPAVPREQRKASVSWPHMPAGRVPELGHAPSYDPFGRPFGLLSVGGTIPIALSERGEHPPDGDEIEIRDQEPSTAIEMMRELAICEALPEF